MASFVFIARTTITTIISSQMIWKTKRDSSKFLTVGHATAANRVLTQHYATRWWTERILLLILWFCFIVSVFFDQLIVMTATFSSMLLISLCAKLFIAFSRNSFALSLENYKLHAALSVFLHFLCLFSLQLEARCCSLNFF